VGSSAEIDYLVVRQGRVVPVEVKSGKGGSLCSLHMVLDNYPECPEGYVLYSSVFARVAQQRLTFIPLYYAGHLADPRLAIAYPPPPCYPLEQCKAIYTYTQAMEKVRRRRP